MTTGSETTCVACVNRERGFCGAVVPAIGRPDSQLHVRRFWSTRRGELIVSRNRVGDEVLVLCEGWAFHFVRLPDGRRQILSFLLPGDLVSPILAIRERLEFSTEALTEVQLNGFRRTEIQTELPTNARMTHALYEAFADDLSGAMQLAVVLGQYSAEARLAHLILHLTQRIAARSVIRSDRYQFPLLQQHIADALGITAVHVNRTMRLFRERNLIGLSGGILEILDRRELERLGQWPRAPA
ncbi:MAG: Crp/Fnr family transcriptional regulator [Xanthobacteraceae bacterium]